MSLVTCYNKGCGKSFDPGLNDNDACVHHPGIPVFHDAYKGWSCCNKKCTDFTEFLNIKGCTTSPHNPVKPTEPDKYIPDKSTAKEILEVRAPEPKAMERPSIDTPLTELKPTIAKSLLDQVQSLLPTTTGGGGDAASSIPLGTQCKNNACKETYEGPQSLSAICAYHAGVPVFHEGLKFWSCCNKKTTDFAAFLEQKGCTHGEHVWIKPNTDKGKVKCRLDWFQTGTNVVVSIFAKKYDPARSKIQVSPVRLKIDLYFPEEDGHYQQDIELKGIINIEKTTASMLGSKVELTLHKAEVGSWSRLEVPNASPAKSAPAEDKSTNDVQHKLDTVDLSDL
uniref:Cysteine and histidine-rich domain-containing protein n=1 Tax=Cacopsylla melanoneura TaxID=428564 RepID=A0A8D8SBL2_9HEMI